MSEIDYQDTDLTDPHGEAEMLRAENERMRIDLAKVHAAAGLLAGTMSTIALHSPAHGTRIVAEAAFNRWRSAQKGADHE